MVTLNQGDGDMLPILLLLIIWANMCIFLIFSYKIPSSHALSLWENKKLNKKQALVSRHCHDQTTCYQAELDKCRIGLVVYLEWQGNINLESNAVEKVKNLSTRPRVVLARQCGLLMWKKNTTKDHKVSYS